MNKLPVILTATLLLSACSGIITTPMEKREGDRLAACTKEGTPFETLAFDEWADTYHETVAEVVEAHMDSLRSTNTAKLQCTAEDYVSMVKPTDELRELAESLPPWQTDAARDNLSETDIGPVLLEYLRTYECSLSERRNFLSIILPREWRQSSSSKANTALGNLELSKSTVEGQRAIDYQLLLSRPALDRTLLIVGGHDRLRPLSLDIECLKRVSLDIRNIMGLVSQTSACMPRIRDARGSMRDLPDLDTP